MLASSARLLMRQLFLGRGANDEVHKGITGNTMLISQPSPSYEQMLPNTAALTEGLVVLFCKSAEDVSKAQVLVVNREEYRAMVQHKKQVCPVFVTTAIDSDAIDNLPENAVPDILIQSAIHMPEVSHVKATMHGPASRIPMFSRQEADANNNTDDESHNSDEEPPAGAGSHLAGTTRDDPGPAGGGAHSAGTSPDDAGCDARKCMELIPLLNEFFEKLDDDEDIKTAWEIRLRKNRNIETLREDVEFIWNTITDE